MSDILNFNTGTVVVGGYFDLWAAKRGEGRTPSFVELSILAADDDERDAIISLFPKSVRLHKSSLSRMGLDDRGNRRVLGYSRTSIKLATDGVNGGRNETGIKRLHSALRAAERAGLDVVYAATAGNSYDSLAELLAAIDEPVAEPIVEPVAEQAPVEHVCEGDRCCGIVSDTGWRTADGTAVADAELVAVLAEQAATTECDNADVEHPGFPCAHVAPVAELSAEPSSFVAQLRRNGDSGWTDLGTRIDAREAANLLRDPMQREGLRFSELHAHVDDLVVGHTLFADNGVSFRLADAELVEPVELCDACHVRSAGHGHFALYCAACAELPYGQAAPVAVGSGTIVERADRATVARLHGADVADFVAERHPTALPLLADGWTVDSALAHVDGSCDRALCTGEHDDDELAVVMALADTYAAAYAAHHAAVVEYAADRSAYAPIAELAQAVEHTKAQLRAAIA